jgi:hypothetical protein
LLWQTKLRGALDTQEVFEALANPLVDLQAKRISRTYAVPYATAATIARLAYGVAQ